MLAIGCGSSATWAGFSFNRRWRMTRLGLVVGFVASLALQQVAAAETRTSDEKACAISGGHIERFGKAQFPYCVKPFSDAGKACSKKSDCVGECLVEDGPAARLAGKGTCQARDEPLHGCFSSLDSEGEAHSVCVD